MQVHYPGLPSHPDHEIACDQMRGFGGVVSFEVNGGLWDTAAFIDSVKLPYIAPSLGSTESLIEQPTVVSYWDQVLLKDAEAGLYPLKLGRDTLSPVIVCKWLLSTLSQLLRCLRSLARRPVW